MATKKDFSEKLEPVEEAVNKAAATISETAKTAAKAAEPAVKAAQKKLKDAAKAAEPKVKAAEKTIKATGKKAASAALMPDVYLQWFGREINCGDLVDRAKEAYKAENKGAVRSCKMYIKPEESVAYYVINGKEGKISL